MCVLSPQFCYCPKAFPVQLGIKMTNLSSADFILVLNLTQICMYMYVYVCMRNLYMHTAYFGTVFYSYQVWSHGLLNLKFTSSTSCVHCGLTMCVDVSTVIAGDVQSDSIYVAFKELQYTPLSLCQWRQSFLSNTEVVVRYVSSLCVSYTGSFLRTGFFAH